MSSSEIINEVIGQKEVGNKTKQPSLYWQSFQAVCQEKRVNLYYTRRLQQLLHGSPLVTRMYKVVKGLMTREALQEYVENYPVWELKVFSSEFVSPRQFEQVRKTKKQERLHAQRLRDQKREKCTEPSKREESDDALERTTFEGMYRFVNGQKYFTRDIIWGEVL